MLACDCQTYFSKEDTSYCQLPSIHGKKMPRVVNKNQTNKQGNIPQTIYRTQTSPKPSTEHKHPKAQR